MAFWDARWRAILADGEGSVLARLLADGYDGIYMDWIEAYEEEHVAAAARRAGIEPARAMVDLILHLRETARKADPGFLLVAQNAAGLLDLDARYRDAIDGIGQEDVWFRGSADAPWGSRKGGDIPNRYRDESSSEGLIGRLKKFQALGKPVFTIDYCLDPANAGRVYEASRREGFVPLVTRVSLSRITETPPP